MANPILIPELCSIIADYLPLCTKPSTLLSLALANRHLYGNVFHLLYSCLILKSESDAFGMAQRLLNEPELGKLVREIHILLGAVMGSSSRSIWGQYYFTSHYSNMEQVSDTLQRAIKAGLLPHLHNISVQLPRGWAKHAPKQQLQWFGSPQIVFWRKFQTECPRLHEVVRQNCGIDRIGWIGPFEFQGISCMGLSGVNFLKKEPLKSLQVSVHLHTLNLQSLQDWTESASPLLVLTFPTLRNLSLEGFAPDYASQAPPFWERHPTLESVRVIASPSSYARWFPEVPVSPETFLPNLRHLQVHFDDVRHLAPILHRLTSLKVTGSINAQIPYLLRSVLPNGLPNLKSLSIGQVPSDNPSAIMEKEGARWYETEDGEFRKAPRRKARRGVLNGFIPSVVRGAPNLEEVAFVGENIGLGEYAKLSSEIARFSNLRRFYFTGHEESTGAEQAMVSNARILAEACRGLTMIVDLVTNTPYLVVRISRTAGNGEISSIDLGSAHYGMQVGSEDDAFPQ